MRTYSRVKLTNKHFRPNRMIKIIYFLYKNKTKFPKTSQLKSYNLPELFPILEIYSSLSCDNFVILLESDSIITFCAFNFSVKVKAFHVSTSQIENVSYSILVPSFSTFLFP